MRKNRKTLKNKKGGYDPRCSILSHKMNNAGNDYEKYDNAFNTAKSLKCFMPMQHIYSSLGPQAKKCHILRTGMDNTSYGSDESKILYEEAKKLNCYMPYRRAVRSFDNKLDSLRNGGKNKSNKRKTIKIQTYKKHSKK